MSEFVPENHKSLPDGRLKHAIGDERVLGNYHYKKDKRSRHQ